MPQVVVVGSFVQDLSFRIKEFPRPGETRIGTFVSGPGGKGFNQAVACHRQQVETLFIGAIGDDLFGQSIKEWAKNEELTVCFQTVEGVASGAAMINVNDAGENQIVVALGANEELSPDFIKEHQREISGASVLVLQLESNIDATREALDIAKTQGVLSLLNPAPINPALTVDILQLSDIITPNETEFAFLIEKISGNKLQPDYWHMSDQDLRDLCELLPVPTIVLTLGRNGAFVSQGGNFSNSQPVNDQYAGGSACYRVQAHEVSTVDTTGAGDAFTGGLAAGLVRFNENLPQAVNFATAVAALSTTKQGTAPAMPNLSEVELYIKNIRR